MFNFKLSLLALLFLLNSAQDGLMCSYSLVKSFPCIIRLFDREYFLNIKTMREKVTATKWGAVLGSNYCNLATVIILLFAVTSSVTNY